MATLGVAYVFFRPRSEVEPRTAGQLRRRTAVWVRAVLAGTAHTLWLAYIAPLRLLNPVADESDVTLATLDEEEIDYECLPIPPPSPTQPSGDALRKMAFRASYGDWRGAWGCASPSPAVDPREDDAKRAVINFTTQTPFRPLTAAGRGGASR
jgi:hypothetical protein